MKIGLVAGEQSGDHLAAGLMRELKKLAPDVTFSGIGGPAMMSEGLTSFGNWQHLNMNGFVEPIRNFSKLLRLYSALKQTFVKQQPDVFVGVDFNVFNLLLEKALKRSGIPTVHYVSPSVYAWRRRRIKSIGNAADRVLTLFPFEPDLYRAQKVDALFVGHPLADEIGLDSLAEMRSARRELNLDQSREIIALLPGSRTSEIRQHGALFLAAARRYSKLSPDAIFMIPTANRNFKELLQRQAAEEPKLDLRIVLGRSREVIAAADALICKSGTSTLEAMLFGKPMVVSYRLGRLSYRLVSALLKTPWVALPNILAQQTLVPELIQDEATPESLAGALAQQIQRFKQSPEPRRTFADIHAQLRRGADTRAAQAVLELSSAMKPVGRGRS